MDFDIGESRNLYKQTTERFVGSFDNVVRQRQRTEPAGFSRLRWTEMAELGLLQLPIAEEEGGMGGSAGDCAVVAQAFGYGVALEPWLECGFWPAFLLQARALIEKVASGERLCAVAHSEPDLDGHWAPLTTVAERRGDHYRLAGEKRLVLGGAAADMFIVTANHRGSTLCFLIPRDRQGVSIRPYR
jgi:alkylation response protein AidB-like acyl-CoA dehydrogenase